MLKNNTELLKKAFLDASLIEMSAFLDGTENDDHNFSLEFEQKINSVIEEAGKPKKHLNKRKIIAILVAAAILVSLMFTAVVFGDKINSFFIDITDRSFDFLMDNNSEYPERIEKEYYPTYIPNGYALTSSVTEFFSLREYWFSDGDREICFEQFVLNEGTLSVSNDNGEYETQQLGDILIYYFEGVQGKHNIMVWEYQKYMFQLFYNTELGLEEGFKIIESIQEKQ